jgi:PKD repeat protein
MRIRLLAVLLASLPAAAPGVCAQPAPLMVVYGPEAPTREGDADHMERLYLSVPADLEDRIYLRIFDPEPGGTHDTRYGRSPTTTTTLFRLSGGDGAYSRSPAPAAAADGATPSPTDRAYAGFAGGRVIAERRYDPASPTDDAWTTLAPFAAADGERIGDRAFFRLDAIGEAGDNGNAFAVEASLSPDRSDPPPGVRLFAHAPTIRWREGGDPTEVRFTAPEGARLHLQSFDGAEGEIALVSTFGDVALPASGQDEWRLAVFEAPGGTAAITLRGGAETPNDVTLAILDAAGRPVELEMPPRPAPRQPRPTPVAVARPLANCTSVAFDASASTGPAPLGFRWRFGDGAASDAPVIAHAYAEPGRYQAELEVLAAGDHVARGARAQVPVHVRPAPVAAAGEPVIAAPGEPVAFDGRRSRPSDRPITGFHWTFADGIEAEGATATHAYERPGLYRAVLRVEDDSGHPCDFGVATRDVTVNFPPVAEAGEDRSAATGEPVTVGGGASYDVDGTIAAHRWDMGDGTRLDGATVTHAYAAPGTYTATLTVEDDSGVANAGATDTVTIRINAPPVPAATGPDRPIAVGEIARLDAGASSDADGAILSWSWDFGDGATGEGPSVQYAWAAPGVYPVTLTVADDSATGSATATTRLDVTVSAAPIADAGPDQSVAVSDVDFDGGGSHDPDGAIRSYDWSFGDGATASGRSVRHAYARPGTYEVVLVVRDDSGAPLNLARDTAVVRVNAAPIADAGPDLVAAPGQEVVLDGSGSVDPDGAVTDWLWRFPDGTEARGFRVARNFGKPGLQRVLLTVRDDTGLAEAYDVDEVAVAVNAPPVAAAGPDLLVAPGDPVRLDGAASYDPDGTLASHRWDFDDLDAPVLVPVAERSFETPGVYGAQLTVVDASGAGNATGADEVVVRVNHPPVAEAGPEIVTDRLYVTLDGSGSSDADGDQLIHTWDFGDGSPPALGATVTHAYPRSGIFPVKLTVDDGTGVGNAVAVDTTRVVIDARPVAVAGGNRDVCSGDAILFDGSASSDPDGGLLRYSWDFGDGTRAQIVNPSKTYETPGVYTVTLTVEDESGLRIGVHSDRIAAVVREAPIADAGPAVAACTGQTVRLDGSGSSDADGAVNAFSWNFGDGTTGGGERPTHVFERPGTYTVTLTIAGDARGACGALDTDETTVTVVEAPRVEIVGPDRAAAGAAVRFEAALAGDADVRGAEFSWDFGDGATGSGPTVEHAFAEPGERTVTLRALLPGANEGCGTIETRRIVAVNASPEPVIGGPDRAAAGALVLFDASASTDPDGAITGFEWDLGDGTTARGVQTQHRFAAPGTYEVRLAATDDAGVGNSRVVTTRSIEVSPPPAADLAAPPALCPGVPHLWSVAENAADLKATWLFGDGVEVEGPEADHAFEKPGVFPVAVTLDDGGGLVSSRRTEEVYVRVNQAPVAIAGPDRVVCPGDSVAFDAGLSADLDGTLTGWRWTFSDGVVLEGQEVERSFDTPGPREVRLTVTDDSGSACAAGTDTARVLVNAPPTVDAGPDRDTPVGAANDTLVFDARAAADPDGQGVQVEWDFGDGTRASNAIVRHRFAGPGDYTVRVEARDTTGLACGVASDTATVHARARE